MTKEQYGAMQTEPKEVRRKLCKQYLVSNLTIYTTPEKNAILN